MYKSLEFVGLPQELATLERQTIFDCSLASIRPNNSIDHRRYYVCAECMLLHTHLSDKLLDFNFEVGHKGRCPLLVRDLGTEKASSQQSMYSQLVCTYTTWLIFPTV